MSNWKAQDISNAKYIGVLEFQSNDGEYHTFEIVQTQTHLVFGGATNTGLLESGNFVIDDAFSTDENLQELVSDLESYYNDGAGYQTDNFACNERM